MMNNDGPKMLTSSLGQRLLSDIAEQERTLRQQAETKSRAYQDLLLELANRLNGKVLEEIRREAPGVLDSWTPVEWKTFFYNYIIPERSGWSQDAGNGNSRDVERLQRENQALNTQIAQLLEQLASTSQTVIPTSEDEEPLVDKHSNSSLPKLHQNSTLQSHIKTIPHQQLLAKLREFKPPQIPSRYQAQVNKLSRQQWRRGAMALFLIARYGYNIGHEIGILISLAEGLKPVSGSVKRVITRLSEVGFLQQETLSMNKPKTSLSLLRLTKDGQQLCHILGWEAVFSDWERLIEHHLGEQQKRHTLAVMAVGMHARLRGWLVQVMPTAESNTPPDMLVEKDGQRHYVEVELSEKENSAKWRNIAALQGHIALVAGKTQSRSVLVGDIKRMKINGVASDLETLIRVKANGLLDDYPMWNEEW